MVCRTGLNTQVGGMVRQLASPSQLAHQKDPFIKVTHPHPYMLLVYQGSPPPPATHPPTQPPSNPPGPSKFWHP